MQNSAEAEKIISQANAWTFQGDCTLLQWMQKISENLEQHVNKTSKSLEQLNANTKRTGIALDNAANSLTALQYTQFVESRCQDDDETITNAVEGAVDTATNENTSAPTSAEVLKMFMMNNVQMLQNCHEKYALDFDDSDDDDAATAAANNCIYQAKNPYNERPLPHIYGSKLWKENWHVGLCDGTNDYSGDEMSEAFSESSDSIEENESYGSNSAHTSDWASSSSVLHDKYAQNAAATRTLQPSIPALPKPIAPIVAALTPTKSLPTSAVRLPEHDDLFATLQHTPPTTTSSSTGISNTSSRETSQASSYSSSDKRNTYQQRQPDTATPAHNAAAVAEEIETRKPTTSNIKRKPVNLFDDDDFNSLMSKIVDKAQGNKADTPVAAPRKLSKTTTPTTNTPTLQAAAAPARINKQLPNLFDSPRSSPEREHTFLPAANAIEVPKNVAKQPLNLFDSPEASPPNDLYFPAAPKTTATITNKITPKSLFDDDEDDDDFLNVFGARKANTFTKPQTIGRTSLFDDDDDVDIDIAKDMMQHAVQAKQTNAVVVQTIGNAGKIATKENTDFLNERHSIGTANNADVVINATKQDKEKTLLTTKKVNLFDDVNDDEEDAESGNLFNNTKSEAIESTQANPIAVPNKSKNSIVQSEIEETTSMNKKVNLFDDFGDGKKDTENIDILRKKNSPATKTNASVATETNNKEKQEQIARTTLLTKKDNLFGDIVDDKDMFSSLKIKTAKKLTPKNDVGEIISPTNTNNAIGTNFVSEVEEAASITMSKQAAIITANAVKEVHDETVKTVMPTTTHISGVNEQTSPTITNVAVEKATSKHITQVTDIPTIVTEIETVSTKSNIEKESVNQTVTIEAVASTNSEVELDPHTNNVETISPTNNNISSFVTPTVKPTTTTNYGNIFLDEPPDDDDFFQTLSSNSISVVKSDNDLVAHDFYEPPLPESPSSSVMPSAATATATTPKETNTSTINVVNQKEIISNSASDYSGLRLFSDVPPDDDDDDVENFVISNAVEPTKTLHNVFYDDFNETATAIQNQATANKLKLPQNILFDDEPPTDEDDFSNLMGGVPVMVKTITEKGAGDPFTKEIETEKKTPQIPADETDRVSQLSNEISKTTLKNAVEAEKTNVAQIKPTSKLPKLNINVQALLPNPTGRLNYKKTPEANVTPNTSVESDNTTLISPQTTTPTPTIATTVDADTGSAADGSDRILTSMCKTRVRAPAQRRPSTRRGRQENYRKSLLMAEDEDENVVTTQAQQQTLTSKTKPTTLPTVSRVEQIPDKEEPELQRKHDTIAVVANKLSSNIPTFLDANDDDGDDDLMFGGGGGAAVVSKTPTNLFSTATAITTKVDDEQLTKSVDKVVSQSSTTIIDKKSTTIIPKKSVKGLFDDSDASDEAGDLFASKNTFESDKLSSKTQTAISQNISTTVNPLNTVSVQPNVTPETVPTTAPTKPAAKSLFSDTNSDSDDDLFKTTNIKNNNLKKNSNNSVQSKATEPPVNQLPQPKQIPVKSSTTKLFDSDSDDNDSNFLGTLKAKPQQPQVKSQTVKPSAPKGSKGLFSDSDSDDDDDLFGNKKHKVAVKNIPGKQGPTTTKAAIATNVTGTINAKLQDNPLADLLN